MNPATLLVRRGQVGSAEVDLRIESDRIVEIGARLRRSPGETELDARGAAVLPGFHDHHLHLRSLAAANRSVAVGPPQVHDLGGLSAALAAAAARVPAGAWVRAVGYHESVAGDLDRAVLDRIVTDRPVRVQHRTGVLWVCNSSALQLLGAEAESEPGIERDEQGRLTGRLWRMDGWLAARLEANAAGPGVIAQPHGVSDRAALGELSAAAIAVGVTGWTDATPGRTDSDARSLADAVATGIIRQRLHLMVSPSTGADAAAEVEEIPWVTAGPVKIMLDDRDLPSLDDLAALIARAHAARRPVAVHCVTRVQLLLTLSALEATGTAPGDRIEHGAVIPAAVLPHLAASDLIVVTQPNFVAERGDQYLSDVPPDEVPDLWRARSLVDAGVGVAAGSDAPFGSPDPWGAVRAATSRRTASGQVLGAGEAVDTSTALRWWWGSGRAPTRLRRIQPGEPADLVVLGAPLGAALAGDDPVPVAATLVGGAVVFPF
jgi:predicted amidohydrolase YtcJ